MSLPDDGPADEPEWLRLDPRMLLILPLRELARFLPALIAIFLAGTAAGRTDWWHGIGIAVPVVLGVLRYLTTFVRVTETRVELRRGLLNRHVLSTPRDRVRTVDVTASLTHRALGLTTVRIGTGTASQDEEDHLDLDGLTVATAQRLRAELLGRAGPDVAPEPERTVLRLDLGWVRFAPLTTTGLVLVAAFLGILVQALNVTGAAVRLETSDVGTDASLWLVLPVGALIGLVMVSALAVAGYAVANWDFTLTRTRSGADGAWHLRRGLLTTRETTVDDARVSGISLVEPAGLRLAGGARVSAIVTGLDRDESGASLLAPPCPRGVAVEVGAAVLGTSDPLASDLADHGPRARSRRFTRALVPALALAAVVAALVLTTGLPAAWLVVAALGVPALGLVARDRAASLGHLLLGPHLVARSGSLQRRTDVLDTGAVIGWNLRTSWFQRRAGLATLVATTAGGPQAVTVLDVPEAVAVGLAHRAHAELLEPFLAVSPETFATARRPPDS